MSAKNGLVYAGRGQSSVNKSAAQVIGDELQRLADSGVPLTEETVVRAATPEDSALHGFFQWDNAAAGHMYRLLRAGYLIRNYLLIRTEDASPVRPLYNVSIVTKATPKGERAYHTRDIVVRNDDALSQVSKMYYRQRALPLAKEMVANGLSKKDPYWGRVVHAIMNGSPRAVRENDQP